MTDNDESTVDQKTIDFHKTKLPYFIKLNYHISMVTYEA